MLESLLSSRTCNGSLSPLVAAPTVHDDSLAYYTACTVVLQHIVARAEREILKKWRCRHRCFSTMALLWTCYGPAMFLWPIATPSGSSHWPIRAGSCKWSSLSYKAAYKRLYLDAAGMVGFSRARAFVLAASIQIMIVYVNVQDSSS